MAVTKLSSLMMLGAVAPYFVPEPLDLCISFLPSFWMGKAVAEKKPIAIWMSILVAICWIIFVKKKYDRKIR